MRNTTGVLVMLFFGMIGVFMQGCYSFSGASLPAHIESVAVPLFDDTSGAGISGFRETITRSLVTMLETQSRLVIESDPARADAVLKGVITSYTDEPSQLGSATERAVTNRITLVIKAEFNDQEKQRMRFSQSFVGFADYESGNYTAQQVAIDSAIDMAVEDIFNRMISDW